MDTYGYFYKRDNPKQGKKIRVNGLYNEDRKKAALENGIEDYDVCLLLYHDSTGKEVLNSDYEPFAKAMSKDGERLLVHPKTFVEKQYS